MVSKVPTIELNTTESTLEKILTEDFDILIDTIRETFLPSHIYDFYNSKFPKDEHPTLLTSTVLDEAQLFKKDLTEFEKSNKATLRTREIYIDSYGNRTVGNIGRPGTEEWKREIKRQCIFKYTVLKSQPLIKPDKGSNNETTTSQLTAIGIMLRIVEQDLENMSKNREELILRGIDYFTAVLLQDVCTSTQDPRI